MCCKIGVIYRQRVLVHVHYCKSAGLRMVLKEVSTVVQAGPTVRAGVFELNSQILRFLGRIGFTYNTCIG